MNEHRLCEYGCGQEAIHQFKNGKWCCCNNFSKCIGYRNKLSNLRKGKLSPHKGKIRNYSEEARKKMGNSKRGKLAWNSGLKECFKSETLIKMKNSHIGKTYITEDGRNRIKEYMLNGGSIKANKNIKRKSLSEITKKKISISNTGKKRTEEFKETKRQMLLNGGAIKMIKAIKKISKEEIKLRDIVKELYPSCIFQEKVFNYALDVAIPEFKIAIEYDGYYHFNTEEIKEYHKFRQKRIENEGWKFYRITMFDKFPNKEIVKENIQRLIKEN